MTVTFKTFRSGVGDCIFLLLQSEKEQQFSIMVDCGAYEDAIQKFVKDKLNGEIDLLIVTHIDNDHIMGVSEMLSDRIKVKKGIIFNSYKRNGGKEETINLNESQIVRLRAIERKIGIIVEDIISPVVTYSAKSAIRDLSTTILSNPKLKEIWEREYTTSGTQLDLNEWGMITFLSPTTTELDNLDSEFRQVLFDELNIDKAMGEWDKKEQLFEILLRYATLHESELSMASMSKMMIEPEKEMAIDASDVVSLEDRLLKASEESVKTKQITPANQASLAFVWEKDGHRILIMGDANPDIVVEGLKKHYETLNEEAPTPVIFDAIKVSHHGSHYNTTSDLVKCADSKHYFFTGGEEGKRPSEAAVGRIVLSTLPNGVRKRTLHFNFGTSLVKELRNNKDLMGKYGFSVETKKNELKFKI